MPIVKFNTNLATWVGDEVGHGCFYQVAEGPDGYYVTVMVYNRGNGGLTSLYSDNGPRKTVEQARAFGHAAAIGVGK